MKCKVCGKVSDYIYCDDCIEAVVDAKTYEDEKEFFEMYDGEEYKDFYGLSNY
jgi:hypothetical protein